MVSCTLPAQMGGGTDDGLREPCDISRMRTESPWEDVAWTPLSSDECARVVANVTIGEYLPKEDRELVELYTRLFADVLEQDDRPLRTVKLPPTTIELAKTSHAQGRTAPHGARSATSQGSSC